MTQQQLPTRYCRVTLVKPSTSAPNTWFSPTANALVIEGATGTTVRVRFEVEKTLKAEPNKCTLTISNLAPSTRTVIEQKPLMVTVEAGYDGEYHHVFTGDLRAGITTKDGTDWNTKLELGDGDRAYRYARVSRSYPSGTALRTVLGDAAKSLGLAVPATVDTSDLAQQFASGYALTGATRDELTRLLAPFGYRWSIQNGQLQVLRDTQIRADQAPVISQANGMIGSPELGAPDNKGRPPTLKVKTGLYSELVPGGTIVLQAERASGMFRIQKAKDVGDTHGNEWQTELEATLR